MTDDAVAAWSHKGDRKVLEQTLSPFETQLAVIEVSRRPLQLGLLALTDKRLLFVQERLFMTPRRDTTELSEIQRLEIQHRYYNPEISELTIERHDEKARSYKHLGPSEVVAEFLDQLAGLTGLQVIDLGLTKERSRRQRLGLRVASGVVALVFLGLSRWASSDLVSFLLLLLAAAFAGPAIWPGGKGNNDPGE